MNNHNNLFNFDYIDFDLILSLSTHVLLYKQPFITGQKDPLLYILLHLVWPKVTLVKSPNKQHIYIYFVPLAYIANTMVTKLVMRTKFEVITTSAD